MSTTIFSHLHPCREAGAEGRVTGPQSRADDSDATKKDPSIKAGRVQIGKRNDYAWGGCGPSGFQLAKKLQAHGQSYEKITSC